MNAILYTLVGTMFTWLITTFGAANVFLIKRCDRGAVQRAFLGFAAGVMIAASIWSLLLPGIEAAERNNQPGWLVVTVGFVIGVMLLLAADGFVERWRKRFQIRGGFGRKSNEGGKRCSVGIRRNILMMVLAIVIHNIPEGMAVGVAFAMAFENGGVAEPALLSGAIALTIGIAIQNYPEGTAVSLPLVSEGMSRGKAFLIGSISAIVEPIFGVLAAVLAQLVQGIMPICLSLAAGCMIYVVVQELIPEAHTQDKQGINANIGSLGFIVGFLIMMILDVAL